MDAVLLAGGVGARLRPLTDDTPKPLLPINNSSTLDTALHCLRHGGVTRVFVAAGYSADKVRAFVGNGVRWGLDIEVSVEEKPLGTAGPLSLLRSKLSKPFILMNGDILTTLDFKKFLKEATASQAALAAVTTTVSIGLPYGRVTVTGNCIDAVEEKPELSAEVLAGIYLLQPEALKVIPDGRSFGVDELIEALLQRGKGIHRYATDAYWRDIGQLADYEAAQGEHSLVFAPQMRAIKPAQPPIAAA